MRIHSTKALVLTFLITVAIPFVVANVADTREVLTTDDQSCKDLGGTKKGLKRVLVKVNDTLYSEVMFTRCELKISAKSLPDHGSTSRTLRGMGSASAFYRIVERAEMGTKLDEEDEITLFVPSNEAIAKLPRQMVDQLYSDRDAAQTFVRRHCVFGKRLALDPASIKGSHKFDETIVGGDRLARSLKALKGRVVIGDSASIVMADIDTTNGVIDVVDAVFTEK